MRPVRSHCRTCRSSRRCAATCWIGTWTACDPPSGTLAELRRSNRVLRLPLRGLTVDEVQRMLASISQQQIPWRFAELVHRRTEGNPLFVQELLRFLVEQGLVEGREGTLGGVGEEGPAGRIPEGLRGRHLQAAVAAERPSEPGAHR